MYRVSLKQNYPQAVVQVAGRLFFKTFVELSDEQVTDEIKESPLLDCSFLLPIPAPALPPKRKRTSKKKASK